MTVFNKKPIIFIVKDQEGNSVLLPLPQMLKFAEDKKLCKCIKNDVDVTNWIYGHMQEQEYLKLEEDIDGEMRLKIRYTIRRVQ